MMTSDTVVERASWLLERSRDAVMITDLEGCIEYVNPAFEALTGYGRDQVLGLTPAILKSGRQSAEFYRELWETLRAGHEFHGVLVNRRCDGGLFHEEESIRPLFDADGEIRHYLSCGRDVSRSASSEQMTEYCMPPSMVSPRSPVSSLACPSRGPTSPCAAASIDNGSNAAVSGE